MQRRGDNSIPQVGFSLLTILRQPGQCEHLNNVVPLPTEIPS